MAATFTKRQLVPVVPDDAYLSFVALYGPEGNSNTCVANDILTRAADGGLDLAATAAAVTMWGIALEAGHNGATVGLYNIKYMPLFPGSCIYINLLGTAAADFVLLATNFGLSYEAERSTTLVGGADPGWYLNSQAAGASSGFLVIDFQGDETLANSTQGNRAAVGDTNARVKATIVSAETQIFTQI